MVNFRELNGRADFYFVRHGQSGGNIAGVAQGQKEYPLTDLGRSQALTIGKWFNENQAERPIDYILSSPSGRTKETAEIIANQIGHDIELIELDANLMETNLGILSGMNFDNVKELYPKLYRQYRRDEFDVVPEAESASQMHARATAVWGKLFSYHQDGIHNVLAVTHSGMLNWIIRLSCGIYDWYPYFAVRNCGTYHFIVDNEFFPADEIMDEPVHACYYKWAMVNFFPS